MYNVAKSCRKIKLKWTGNIVFKTEKNNCGIVTSDTYIQFLMKESTLRNCLFSILTNSNTRYYYTHVHVYYQLNQMM